MVIHYHSFLFLLIISDYNQRSNTATHFYIFLEHKIYKLFLFNLESGPLSRINDLQMGIRGVDD